MLSLGVAYALFASLVFSASSLVYRNISRAVHPQWMNAFKACMACIGFFFLWIAFANASLPTPLLTTMLLVSGFIGLNLADKFILTAYTHVGTSRTLMIFAFQPLYFALGGWLFLGEHLRVNHFLAIPFTMGCLVTLGVESVRKEGRWELTGLIAALVGVTLDAIGVIVTRKSFAMDPALSSHTANFIRAAGACIGFAIMSRFWPLHLYARWHGLSRRSSILVMFAAFAGTVLSLSFWLRAVQITPLSTLLVISGSGPLFSAVFESVADKRWPTKYFWISVAFFTAGFLILNAA